MQLLPMNVSAGLENKEPAFDGRKHLSQGKKKLSHYLKTVPLMCHEQRTVSLKRPNGFFFEHFIFSGIITKILMKLFKQIDHQGEISSCVGPLNVCQSQFSFASLMHLQVVFWLLLLLLSWGKRKGG
jgi:hypothetical protein